jgi:hypothetical protein
LCLLCVVSFISTPPNCTSAQEKKESNGQSIAEPSTAIIAFNQQVKDFVKHREKLEAKLPKLSENSKPEEIEAHRIAFMERLKAERAGARQGELFSPAVCDHIRRVIKEEFKGKRMIELRKTALGADTKGVPLRVNSAYPETKESIETPPTLLLRLPELPKQLRYRFVGRHLVLVDREAKLIIDYMKDALP